MAVFQRAPLSNELLKVFIDAILINKMPFLYHTGPFTPSVSAYKSRPPMEEMIDHNLLLASFTRLGCFCRRVAI